MPDGCRTARSRDGHMGTDLGHHEGSIAAGPQGSAPAIMVTEGDSTHTKNALNEQRFAYITGIPPRRLDAKGSIALRCCVLC